MRDSLFIAVYVAAVTVAVAAPYPPPEALQLVEKALQHNPALASTRLDADAAHALAHHHNAWEPPEVAVDFFQGPVSAFPNPLKRQEEIDYSVSQKIPFPGKLSAMAEPEHRRGAAAGKRTEAVAGALRRQVLTAYANLYALHWSLRLIQENRTSVASLQGNARARYSGGSGNSGDALRAESELARLDMDILQVEGSIRATRAQLQALVGDSADIDVMQDAKGVEPDLSALEFTLEQSRPDSSGSLSKGLSNRPDLESARLEILASNAEVIAARKELYPDFWVRGTYKDMQNAPIDTWSLMVGVNIPIAPWSVKGLNQGAARARVLHAKAERDYASLRQTAKAELQMALAAVESASETFKISRDKRIPLSQKIQQTTEAEYRAGQADFPEIVEALRGVRVAQEEYHQAAADHLKAWADLEWAVGGEIDGENPPKGIKP